MRMLFVLLVLLIYSLNSIGVDTRASGCGKQQIIRTSKVVGGNHSYDGEFPWTVSIRRNGNHHCGGVIIGQRWILTAAHCVQSQLSTNFIVRIGEYDLHRADHNTRDYTVERIVIHDNYSRNSGFKSANINNADIALLKTHGDIHWNEYAWPVCFPPTDVQSLAGREGIVVGWGKKTEKSDNYSDKLQKVKLSIIDNKICEQWFRMAGRDMQIHDRLICAGYKVGGRDACHGDSGGPLLLKHQSHMYITASGGQEYYFVAGIVSTGIGCARPLMPGLYSNVFSYMNWIYKYLNQ
ncbi:brain-specific serine protease 4-like [Oppia nitens]|uniref:brain-specific serine protease 4-like n=1 Tax=Oppia nitens TaxID=1686743 RepID=UPI0023D9BE51|nr:brain-specific serine protease 4-like [Oppia nitens]